MEPQTHPGVDVLMPDEDLIPGPEATDVAQDPHLWAQSEPPQPRCPGRGRCELSDGRRLSWAKTGVDDVEEEDVPRKPEAVEVK